MSTAQHETRHPVISTVTRARDDLRSVARTPVWSLSATETGAALVEVTRLAAQVAQLKMRLLAHAERVQVGADEGSTSAANWLAHQFRTTRPAPTGPHAAKALS